jgi:hypothetical protein
MIDIRIDCAAVCRELTSIAGHAVELLERRTPAAGERAYLVAPVERQMLQEPFWQAVLRSPSAGIWDTPEAALVGFAAGARGWTSEKPAAALSDVESGLRERLRSGPVPAAILLSEYAAVGVSNHRVGRAARRIGVTRHKHGMRGGWIWSLPEECAPSSQVGAEEREGCIGGIRVGAR